MPTYNRQYCICNAVDSVLNQDYQEFELIIIDDKSEDGTSDMLRNRYMEEIKSGKIKYITLDEHAGVSYARNEGLRIAKNDWIAYCDTDNEWYKDFLSTFVSAINKNFTSKCFYAKLKRKSNGSVFGVQKFDREKLFSGNFIDLGVFVHNRDLYIKYGGFDEKLKRLVDLDLILTYTCYYRPIFIDKCVLMYNDVNEQKRISNTENLETAKMYITNKHKIKLNNRLEKGNKMFWLRTKKHLGLITGEKYANLVLEEKIKMSKLFDEDWYKNNNSDVDWKKIKPIEHYLSAGWKNGLNPSQKFDNNGYLSDYPDVAAANICPLVHYINHGYKEGRYIRMVSGLESEVILPATESRTLGEKIRYVFAYPLRVYDEYTKLKEEIKESQK